MKLVRLNRNVHLGRDSRGAGTVDITSKQLGELSSEALYSASTAGLHEVYLEATNTHTKKDQVKVHAIS